MALDFDHLGVKVGEHLPGSLTGEYARGVEIPDAIKNVCHHIRLEETKCYNGRRRIIYTGNTSTIKMCSKYRGAADVACAQQ
jgi:hypothetical protein